MTLTGLAGMLFERDVVHVSGDDATDYLQGQISQDVNALEVGQSAWSLVLTPRGKLGVWFRISRRSDGFLLDLDAGYGTDLITRLERFKLRVDVTITMLEGWQMLAIRDDQAFDGTGLGLKDDDQAFNGTDHLASAVNAELCAEVAWPGFNGIDMAGPDVSIPQNLRVVSDEEFQVARIRAGWPLMGHELTERTIPAEVAGLVECSVDFDKGCYTGQELVARIDSRGGNVPRPVRLLEIRGSHNIKGGAPIVADGKQVGMVTSAAVDHDAAVTVALGTVHRRVVPVAPVTVDGIGATVFALR